MIVGLIYLICFTFSFPSLSVSSPKYHVGSIQTILRKLNTIYVTRKLSFVWSFKVSLYYDLCYFLRFVVTTDCSARKTSQGKIHIFLFIYPPHLPFVFNSYLDFTLYGTLIHTTGLMWFMYFGPTVCLDLLSDFTSRWTPLVWRCLRGYYLW